MQEGSLQRHITAGGVVGNFRDVAKFVPIDSSYPKGVIARQDYYEKIGFIRNVYDALSDLQVEHRALKDYLALELYDDPQPRSFLYGLPPKVYLPMAGHQPPFPTRIAKVAPGRGTLLSKGKRATQSSLSHWSVKDTLEGDAGGALDGRKTGGFRFHTGIENGPWWMVDLEKLRRLRQSISTIRLQTDDARGRARRLAIDVAIAADSWAEVHRKDDDTDFGGADGNPLIWTADRPIFGRFVRIRF